MKDDDIQELQPVLFNFWDKLLNIFSIISIVLLIANIGFYWDHFFSVVLSFSIEAIF